MFSLDTLKTKTFWTGLISIITGGYLCYIGQSVVGLPMISAGSIAITGRDAITKIINLNQGK